MELVCWSVETNVSKHLDVPMLCIPCFVSVPFVKSIWMAAFINYYTPNSTRTRLLGGTSCQNDGKKVCCRKFTVA